MPTDQEIDASVATAERAEGTSSETTDDVMSHPKYKELEQKYAAARQGMDKTNLSKKELQAEVARLRVLAGEEEKVETAEETQTVTKAELHAQLWELQNSKDVEIYGDDEYKQDVEKGIPREYALKTAKLRFQSNPDKARLERQHSMASGSNAGIRNLESADMEGFNEEEAKKWGYTKETWLKQKELKKARG